MDRVCIAMPEDFYKFLFAVPVVQDYSLQLVTGAQRGQRDKDFQITFRMDGKYKFFEPCLRVVRDNVPIFDYTGWSEKARREFDCFVDLDFLRAERIALRTDFHITMALNTIIGSGAGQLPIFKALPLQAVTDPCDVLILPWDDVESTKFYEYLLNNHPELDIIMDPRDMTNFLPEDILNYVNTFSCVIGNNGPITYIATALKKAVIDLFKTHDDGVLYGNYGAPLYQGVVGPNVSANWLWSVWRQECPQILAHMSITKSHAEQTLRVSAASIAEHAGGKSSA